MSYEQLIELAIAREENQREMLAPLPWDEPDMYDKEIPLPYIPVITNE
jgi:hypothetical protein